MVLGALTCGGIGLLMICQDSRFRSGTPAGTDDTSVPVVMLVNSSELRAADFPLAEVRTLQLDEVSHGGRRTRGAVVRKLRGVGNSTLVLSVENDNDFRSRCRSEYLDTLGLVKYFSSKRNVLVLRRPRGSGDLPVCRIGC
jgi:hypothetical protein